MRDDDVPTSWPQFWPQVVDPPANGKAVRMSGAPRRDNDVPTSRRPCRPRPSIR